MSQIKKISAIYDQGTAKEREDGYVVRDPFFIVIDGFSEPNAPSYHQTFMDGLTLGEVITKVIETIFKEAIAETPLTQLLRESNRAVRERKISGLAGATFAAAKVKEREVEIIAAGDAFALVRLKNNKIFITENQVHFHDTLMNAEISWIMQEVAQEWRINLDEADEEKLEEVRKEMWNRFCPILTEARSRDINNPRAPYGYGALNGDSRLERIWQKLSFPTSQIEKILLFTDGLIDWEFLKNMEPFQLKTFILELYQRGGIEGILHFTRSAEAARASRNYITHAEATVIAVEFE